MTAGDCRSGRAGPPPDWVGGRRNFEAPPRVDSTGRLLSRDYGCEKKQSGPLQQTTQAGLATGNMPANPADLERVLLLHTAKRRSSPGPCRCSTDTARSPACRRRQVHSCRRADRSDHSERGTVGSRGSRGRCSAGSAAFGTPGHTGRRRRRRTLSRMSLRESLKGPDHGPPGPAGCCIPRTTAAGRPPRQPSIASFAF
jgi:hypothetical protein